MSAHEEVVARGDDHEKQEEDTKVVKKDLVVKKCHVSIDLL